MTRVIIHVKCVLLERINEKTKEVKDDKHIQKHFGCQPISISFLLF